METISLLEGIFLDTKKRNSNNNIYKVYEEHYSTVMNYYDHTRKIISELKSMDDIIINSLIYNISSSSNSIIKNYLLEIYSSSDILVVRNVVESIVIYNLLYNKELGYKYKELFYYHLSINEYNYLKLNPKIKLSNKSKKSIDKKYKFIIKKYIKITNVNEENASKKYSMRFGWAYGLCKKNKVPSMKELVMMTNDPLLKKIYGKGNLNAVVHLDEIDTKLTEEDILNVIE